MRKVVTFMLRSLHALDPIRFGAIGAKLGLTQTEAEQTGNHDADKSSNRSEKNNALDKKEKMKKRQNKLLEKMKNKGKKMLEKSNVATNLSAPEAEANVETYQCAFCQEELHISNFLSSPFGNFTYCQSSKLFYHSILQTEQGQLQALKSADLAQQFCEDSNKGDKEGESEVMKSSLIEEEEEKQPERPRAPTDPAQIQEEAAHEGPEASGFMQRFMNRMQTKQPLESGPQFLKPLRLVEEFCDRLPSGAIQYQNKALHTTFMNPETGSSSALSNCKHYSHVECLRKYHL
jgi:hypothetical protein